VIREKGKTPLFVGGTGFYLDSFFKGLSRIPAIDKGVKASLRSELAERGLAPLYEELMGCDPQFARSIHPNDRQRILRGLEVYRGSGRPLSDYFSEKIVREGPKTLYLGIEVGREELVRRIEIGRASCRERV
jgi:tRNA dimethylallyltransferase